MAQFFPSLEQIKKLKVQPEKGEWHFLHFLEKILDDSYEIYFQTFLNGDRPDIVLMRKNAGVMIIEVKNWQLVHYYIDTQQKWRLKSNNALIKSPLSQVTSYKKNLFYLHIEKLLERKILNSNAWGLVSCAVYFHNETEEKIINFCKHEYSEHTNFLGYNSLTKQLFEQFLYKTRLSRNSKFFDDTLYENFKHHLQPPLHTLEQGISIEYSKKQQELIVSKPKEQKIFGVAGSGKTKVLAKRATNAHLRTQSRILILTFNITLKNYIHDKISEVREKFAWDNFYIINYHQFFKLEANNFNLEFSDFSTDFENEEFFENKKNEILKYDSIFIDEIQDYESQWITIIKKYFLVSGGEFVLFGDEKQNVYQRKMDGDKKPNTGIPGRPNKLNESYRLTTKIVNLALDFQKYFFQERYEFDEINIFKQQSIFDIEEKIQYIFLDANTPNLDIYEAILNQIISAKSHPNDIAVLASTFIFLREIDFIFRMKTHENTQVMFETKEERDKLEDYYKKNPARFDAEIKKIRKARKFQFWMNNGTTKFSTIHSFKGLEIQTLILIIENEDNITEELIYAGITRCKDNLIVINIGNQKYHDFFKTINS